MMFGKLKFSDLPSPKFIVSYTHWWPTVQSYPFQIVSETGMYINLTDRTLPKQVPLTVEKLVEERCVVAAKLSNGGHINDAFHLPLRTRLTVRFERRWNKNCGQLKCSQADSFVEELQRTVYEQVKLQSEQQPPPQIPGEYGTLPAGS